MFTRARRPGFTTLVSIFIGVVFQDVCVVKETDQSFSPESSILTRRIHPLIKIVEAPTSHARNEELGQLFAYRWTNWFNSDFVESYFVPGLGPDSFIGKVLQPPLMTLETKNALRLRSQDNKRGLAPVAWIVSDCDSVSGRRLFVYQLRKYVNIDIYGRGCMTNREWPRKQSKSIDEI